MNERRRLLMAQQENNPWEKLDYLTIVPLNGDMQVKISQAEFTTSSGDIYYVPFSYSLDDGSRWFYGGEDNGDLTVIDLSGDQTLKLRAELKAKYNYYTNKDFFGMRINATKAYAVAGTPVSLVNNNYSDTTLIPRCFSDLFMDSTNLKQILNPKTFLPSEQVYLRSYSQMFRKCTSLVNAPELPATLIGGSDDYTSQACYSYMFSGCTSLVRAPELPSMTLAPYCYSSMFSGCTSLVRAPELPATELVYDCYTWMFRDCVNLNYVKAMFTSYPGWSCTNEWLYGVSSTGTFVKNKDAPWNETGDSSIPSGWTVITE